MTDMFWKVTFDNHVTDQYFKGSLMTFDMFIDAFGGADEIFVKVFADKDETVCVNLVEVEEDEYNKVAAAQKAFFDEYADIEPEDQEYIDDLWDRERLASASDTTHYGNFKRVEITYYSVMFVHGE